MIKKNFKFLAILLIALTIVSSFSICFADENVENNTTTEQSTTESEPDAEIEENIYEGDLYIFDNSVTMDQLVDGNVYIFGNDVTISGQVNGNLFVFGNSIKFDSCYIRYSIYACGNTIYYNGACNDLYVASQKLEMTYDSYVVRDVKAVANNTILQAAIGRDVDLQTNSVDFGSDNKVPIIYGNLRYSANEEQALADGIVEGETTYNAHNIVSSNKSISQNILDVVLAFIMVIATTLVIYAILSKFKKDYIEELSYNAKDILKSIGIGLLTLIVTSVISIILFLTSIGATLAAILVLLVVLIGLITTPLVAILITNLLKPVLKIDKTVMYYTVLALVSIVLYGIKLIPYVGFVISLLISWLGYGLVVSSILPKKELSEEEIQAILAAKEAKRALNAEKKAEKAKLKEAKKIEKAQAKADRKAIKENKEFDNK